MNPVSVESKKHIDNNQPSSGSKTHLVSPITTTIAGLPSLNKTKADLPTSGTPSQTLVLVTKKSNIPPYTSSDMIEHNSPLRNPISDPSHAPLIEIVERSLAEDDDLGDLEHDLDMGGSKDCTQNEKEKFRKVGRPYLWCLEIKVIIITLGMISKLTGKMLLHRLECGGGKEIRRVQDELESAGLKIAF
ncbi:hypothetical protein SUGI_0970750 [Cryptomeria japonica]|nr:hypothetical protein SUGI_0970750 [Cryptomeria japonica]